jgi:hypothetical protein
MRVGFHQVQEAAVLGFGGVRAFGGPAFALLLVHDLRFDRFQVQGGNEGEVVIRNHDLSFCFGYCIVILLGVRASDEVVLANG